METFKVGDYFAPEFEKMKKKEIIDNLDGICYSKTDDEYTKSLGQDELSAKKTELAEISIKIAKLEKEKKEKAAEYNAQLKEPKQIHSNLIDVIKHRTERREGTLWHIDNQENRTMYSFDDDGICVDVRPLKPSEKQNKIKMLNQKIN